MQRQSATEVGSGATRLALALSLFGGAALLIGIWSGVAARKPGGSPAVLAGNAGDVFADAGETVPEPIDPQALWTADIATPRRTFQVTTGELKNRDTISDLLMRLGTTPADAHAALNALQQADLLDARKLRPGLKATVTLVPVEGASEAGASRLVGLNVRNAADHSLIVTRSPDGEFAASRLDARLTARPVRVASTIETSIYDAALSMGAGDQQVVDFARIFAYDVDFQREIHPGDRFEIVYQAMVDERGKPVRTGEVIYAELDGKALKRGFYRFTPSDDGVTDYFDRKGESATKFLMKTPINGARLSSRFGMRRHPISGYSRLHKGTDFAAPSGTAIYAAGHGTVERASRYGGYGNYVRIRHANGYKTAYAHMSRYGPGVRKGRRVRQGDVIGYVGSTGASTGPHLHYEVYINGKPVNAMNLNLPTGRKLDAEMLDAFTARRQQIDAIRAEHGAEIDLAGLGGEEPAGDTPGG